MSPARGSSHCGPPDISGFQHESRKMRLLYCLTLDYCRQGWPDCRWAAPQRSNLQPLRHVTALRASASAFNSDIDENNSKRRLVTDQLRKRFCQVRYRQMATKVCAHCGT